MRASDIESVVRVERLCYALPWNSNAYVTELGNPNAFYAVAKQNKALCVGYGGIWIIMDELHITTLAVDPAERGKGTGEMLLVYLMHRGRERRAERATLEVRQSNKAAIHLYHKYGFEDVGLRKGYYSDNNENAIIMWAEEIQSDSYRLLLENGPLEHAS
jgi:ribosomal-protein-alanine N-acetyltransferase